MRKTRATLRPRRAAPRVGERVAIKKITDVFLHVSVRRDARRHTRAMRGPHARPFPRCAQRGLRGRLTALRGAGRDAYPA